MTVGGRDTRGGEDDVAMPRLLENDGTPHPARLQP
jgi:hypothetical protein